MNSLHLKQFLNNLPLLKFKVNVYVISSNSDEVGKSLEVYKTNFIIILTVDKNWKQILPVFGGCVH